MVAGPARQRRERKAPRRKPGTREEQPEEVLAHRRIVAEQGDPRDAWPVLKWAGGKGQLLERYHGYLPSSFGTYHEPFVGGAALFFDLRRRGLLTRALLSDSNDELLNLYRVLRDDVEALVRELRQAAFAYESDAYYAVRDWEPDRLPRVRRAARTVYLNRTGFNGLYRLNRSGRFNVPFGRHVNPKICQPRALRDASAALDLAELSTCDFEVACRRAQAGDLVYLDPPYHPLGKTALFTSYDREGFTAADQERLAATFRSLDARGVKVLLSNSDAPLVHELYDEFPHVGLAARRSINSKGSGRRPITELLVVGRTLARELPRSVSLQ